MTRILSRGVSLSRLRGVGTLLFTLGVASAGHAAEAPWLGEKVFARRPGATIIYVDGQPTTLLYLDYTVVEEDRTHLKLRLTVNGETKLGRIAKSDVLRTAEAPEYYTKVLAATPKNDGAHIQRGWAHHLLDQAAEARADYDKAVAAKPKTWFVWNNRGIIRIEAGDYAGALTDIEEAAKLHPKSPLPVYNRGLIRLRQKDVSQAIKEFEAAIMIDPNYTVAFLDRGAAHELQGSLELARADYEKACELDPRNSTGWSRLAWLLAAHPLAEMRDGGNAVGLAKLGCELSRWKDAEGLAILAAAYAEMGKFDAAMKWQQKALEDAKYRRTQGEVGAAVLESYRQKKPVRIVVPDP